MRGIVLLVQLVRVERRLGRIEVRWHNAVLFQVRDPLGAQAVTLSANEILGLGPLAAHGQRGRQASCPPEKLRRGGDGRGEGPCRRQCCACRRPVGFTPQGFWRPVPPWAATADRGSCRDSEAGNAGWGDTHPPYPPATALSRLLGVRPCCSRTAPPLPGRGRQRKDGCGHRQHRAGRGTGLRDRAGAAIAPNSCPCTRMRPNSS